MKQKLCLFFLALFILSCGRMNAQTQTIEDLKTRFRSASSDNQKLLLLLSLCEQAHNLHADTLLKYARITEQIADKLANTTAKLKAEYYEAYGLTNNGSIDSALAIADKCLQKLEKEYGKIEAEQAELKLQPALLFDAQAQRSQRIGEIDRRKADIEAELKRRREHYEELLERLKIEQERVINNLLPRRYQLRGDAQVFPVTIEIRLPEVSR